MPFFTRPNFEDRQHVQYSGTSITLSGFTNINNTGYLKVKSQTLDFTGTTTASTTYNIAGVNGYINQGELSSLIVEPPIILLSGITGITTVDVTGYYLGSLNSGGSVTWIQPPTSTPTNFTGNTSASCITDLYVTNIHGCSPINIQPTSSDDVYMVMGGGKIGIGTNSLTQKLHVSGNTRLENNNNGDVYLLAANTNNGGNLVRGVIGSSSIADISGRVLSGLFATSGYNTDLSGSNFGDGGTGYLKNALTIRVAGNNPRGDINIGTRNPNKFLRFFSGTDDFDSGSLRGSLNSNGYWGFGTNLTGQTATVQIGDTTNPGSFKYIHTGGTISPGYVLTTTDSSGNAIWQELPQNSIIDPYYQVTGGTFTWDVSGNSSNYEVLLTSNSTINLINVQNGQYGTLISTQDGVGSRSIAFGTVNGSAITHKVANGGGGLPTLTATANSIDILTFTFNGTVMYWSVGNSYT